MGALDGKVAVVTGAGRGLGRAEALLLAAEGAAVVVNDPGVALSGDGYDEAPAARVVAEIERAGGRAVANHADCADWDGAASLVDTALDAFGRLDVLVNNAGILRDRMSFNMSEDEFDAVVRVHLKGHFVPSHHAARHWRERAKAGDDVRGRVVNTTSESGLLGNTGQVNYTAAKAGIAAMTITLARELAPYGVTVNAVSPRASTRLSRTVAENGDAGSSDGVPSQSWDPMDPANVAPVVAYLASDAAASITGQVFWVVGGSIVLYKGWHPVARAERPGRWTVEELFTEVPRLFAACSSQPEPLPFETEGQRQADAGPA